MLTGRRTWVFRLKGETGSVGCAPSRCVVRRVPRWPNTSDLGGRHSSPMTNLLGTGGNGQLSPEICLRFPVSTQASGHVYLRKMACELRPRRFHSHRGHFRGYLGDLTAGVSLHLPCKLHSSMLAVATETGYRFPAFSPDPGFS